MTAFAKGIVTFLLEVARYAFMQYRDQRRDKVRRKGQRTSSWRPPDENITGNRNSQEPSKTDKAINMQEGIEARESGLKNDLKP
jgi:hypothetical protein